MTENKAFETLMDLEQDVWTARQNRSLGALSVSREKLTALVSGLSYSELKEYAEYRRKTRAAANA